MEEPTVFKVKFEYLNPNNIESEVPEEQKLREPTEDFAEEERVETTENTEIVGPPHRVEKYTVVNPFYSAVQSEVIRGSQPMRIAPTNEDVDIRKTMDIINKESDGKYIDDDKKSKTKIPTPKFKQAAVKISQTRKDTREKEKLSKSEVPSHIPRRSSIPRLKKNRKADPIPITENDTILSNQEHCLADSDSKSNNNQNDIDTTNSISLENFAKPEPSYDNNVCNTKEIQPDDEFDKIYGEIVDNQEPDKITNDSILESKIDDPENVESTFEEIIHAYDEDQVQAANKNKIPQVEDKKIRREHSKIPLLKRKSEHDIKVPNYLDRRSSLKDNNLIEDKSGKKVKEQHEKKSTMLPLPKRKGEHDIKVPEHVHVRSPSKDNDTIDKVNNKKIQENSNRQSRKSSAETENNKKRLENLPDDNEMLPNENAVEIENQIINLSNTQNINDIKESVYPSTTDDTIQDKVEVNSNQPSKSKASENSSLHQVDMSENHPHLLDKSPVINKELETIESEEACEPITKNIPSEMLNGNIDRLSNENSTDIKPEQHKTVDNHIPHYDSTKEIILKKQAYNNIQEENPKTDIQSTDSKILEKIDTNEPTPTSLTSTELMESNNEKHKPVDKITIHQTPHNNLDFDISTRKKSVESQNEQVRELNNKDSIFTKYKNEMADRSDNKTVFNLEFTSQTNEEPTESNNHSLSNSNAFNNLKNQTKQTEDNKAPEDYYMKCAEENLSELPTQPCVNIEEIDFNDSIEPKDKNNNNNHAKIEQTYNIINEIPPVEESNHKNKIPGNKVLTNYEDETSILKGKVSRLINKIHSIEATETESPRNKFSKEWSNKKNTFNREPFQKSVSMSNYYDLKRDHVKDDRSNVEENNQNEDNDESPLIKGKVSRLINRLHSNETPLSESPKQDIVDEMPKKKTVLSKIAMFETIPATTHSSSKPKIVSEILKKPSLTNVVDKDESHAPSINSDLESVTPVKEIEEYVVLPEDLRKDAVLYEKNDINDSIIQNDYNNIEHVTLAENKGLSYTNKDDSNNLKNASQDTGIVHENKFDEKQDDYVLDCENEITKSKNEIDERIPKKLRRFRDKREFEDSNLKRAKSLAELDLGDAVKGKVRAMVVRMNSMDLLEAEKKEVLSIKERPRIRSVSEKVALFEKKLSAVNIEPTLLKNSKKNKDYDWTKLTNSNWTEDDYNTRISELKSAKVTYGRATEMLYVTLRNGVEMPVISVGTALLDPRLIRHIIEAAIDLGYRAIDTAFIYGNEKEVGEAIRAKIEDGTVTREELFITSKLWNTFHRTDLVEQTCRASLDAMGLSYFDLYLIHTPISFKEGGEVFPRIANVLQYSEYDYMDAWFAMEGLVAKGLVRSIGVSNFNSLQLTRVLERAKVKPVVNQVEAHPYLSQQRLDEFCSSRDIRLTCYGVLGSKGTPAELKTDVPPVIDDPLVQVLSAGMRIKPSQLLIRYHIDGGRSVVVKSSNGEHLWDNLQALKHPITPGQVEALHALNRNKRMFTLKGMGETHKNYPYLAPF